MKSPIRAVMVPLDGSPTAEAALAVGAAVARAAGATLHLATVMPPVSTVAGPPGGFTDGAPAEWALREGLQAYLAERAGMVGAGAQPVAAVSAVLEGSTARALASYAAAQDVDLIVMTTHGWTGGKRLWLGSVTDELMRLATCPVLLLRSSGGQPGIGFHRVLVALDGSTDSEAVLESALDVAGLFPGARYTLAQVIEPPHEVVLRVLGNGARLRTWAESHQAAVRSRLEHLGSGLRHRGFAVEVRALVGHGTGEQVLELAHTNGSDLIVIGTRAPSVADRLALGSVADKIVRGATQPVLAVPLKTPPASGARARGAAATLTESRQG